LNFVPLYAIYQSVKGQV